MLHRSRLAAAWQVIRAALGVQNCSADNVGVLEMHGTGTGLGDPIEVGAAFAVFRTAATATQPLELQVITQACHLSRIMLLRRANAGYAVKAKVIVPPRAYIGRRETCGLLLSCISTCVPECVVASLMPRR